MDNASLKQQKDRLERMFASGKTKHWDYRIRQLRALKKSLI